MKYKIDQKEFKKTSEQLLNLNNDNATLIQSGPVLKVIGVGGGGSNAIDHMISNNISGVKFIAADTDEQALRKLEKHGDKIDIIRLGSKLTGGFGAGAESEVGKKAALESESKDAIIKAIEGADMLFIAVGMGGGTGTGAAPVIAKLAKEKGILVVVVATKPFLYEGDKRLSSADEGIKDLGVNADSKIIIPNEKIYALIAQEGKDDISIEECFARINDILLNAVTGIADIIYKVGYINVDFADVKKVMSIQGYAIFSNGEGSGPDRLEVALNKASNNPLLTEENLNQAEGLLLNITVKSGKLAEMRYLDNYFKKWKDSKRKETSASSQSKVVRSDPYIILGYVFDKEMNESDCKITLIATGIRGPENVGQHSKNNFGTRMDLRTGGGDSNKGSYKTEDAKKSTPAFLRHNAS